jgi:hypothetical protein
MVPSILGLGLDEVCVAVDSVWSESFLFLSLFLSLSLAFEYVVAGVCERG